MMMQEFQSVFTPKVAFAGLLFSVILLYCRFVQGVVAQTPMTPLLVSDASRATLERVCDLVIAMHCRYGCVGSYICCHLGEGLSYYHIMLSIPL